MKHNSWNKVVVLTSTDDLWFDSGLGLTKQLQDAGMTVFKPAAFEPGSPKPPMLREIKRSGNRIVILIAYDQDLEAVALSARTEGMSRGWAWVLSRQDSATALWLQGWLFLQPLLPRDGMQDFAEQVSDYTKSSFNISLDVSSVDLTYSIALHNAIMLYAHAATKVLVEGGDLRDGEAVTKAVRSTTFKGVGGIEVALNARGDRIESYEVINYVLEANGTLGSVLVGVYNCTLEQYEAYKAVVWPGNTTEVPADYISGAPLPGHASRGAHRPARSCF